jgi:hypothetical protein
MEQLRVDFANIAAALDTPRQVDSVVFLRLAEVLVESFRSLNRTRLEGRAGRPKLHCILNFRHLEANLTSLLGKRPTGESGNAGGKKPRGQTGGLFFIFYFFYYLSFILARFLKYKCEQIQT